MTFFPLRQIFRVLYHHSQVSATDYTFLPIEFEVEETEVEVGTDVSEGVGRVLVLQMEVSNLGADQVG